MISFIGRLIRALFLIFILLVTAPTLIFLIKWYYAHLVSTKTYVGVLELPNAIGKSEEIIGSAKTLFSSPDIRGIIVKCNGIGGNPGTCQAIHADLVKLKNLYKKPLIAYCERSCLAGSYLIATACDAIVVSHGALIGYLGRFLQEQQLIETPQNECSKVLIQEYAKQFSDILVSSRKNINLETMIKLSSSCVTGNEIISFGLADTIGGSLEVERLMRTKTVIEGSIEEVHGSLVEHFIMYVTDLVNRIIRNLHSHAK